MLGVLLMTMMIRWSLVQLLLTDGAMRPKAGLGFKIAPYTGVAVLAGRLGRDIAHDDDSGFVRRTFSEVSMIGRNIVKSCS